ncbi:MAG: hypothetical protein K9W44_12215 [Candidatus Lokiarchaeota archaeon]|nr:hypothetical protein [Candidatus Harpocratesius repetitus]
MSSPTSTKLTPPIYVDPRIRRRFIWLYLIQIWISLIPAAFLLFWILYPWFIQILPSILNFPEISWTLPNLLKKWWQYPTWVAVIFLPILLGLVYVITVIWSACVTKILHILLNKLHPPKEGVFYRHPKDKDYLFWNLRNLTRIFLFWLNYSSPFIFFKKKFTFSFFGVRIGKNSEINHTWISPEFIEIGNNVIIGQSAAIYSYLIQGDKILVAKTIIEDNVQIGPQVILLPGTHVKERTIIDGGSFSHPFTIMEENSVYSGCPTERKMSISELQKKIFQQ